MSDTSRIEAVEELKKVQGIGPFKANILYDSGYTTIEKLSGASVEDLVAVKGISNTAARKIHDSVREYLGIEDENAPEDKKEEEQEETSPGTDGEDGAESDASVENGSEEPSETVVSWEDDGEEEAEATSVEEWGEKEWQGENGGQEKREIDIDKWAQQKKINKEKILARKQELRKEWAKRQRDYKLKHLKEKEDEKKKKEEEERDIEQEKKEHNMEVYETALEQAWMDGLISEDERALLASLRAKLDITGDEHMVLEDRVRQRKQARGEPVEPMPEPAPVQQPLQPAPVQQPLQPAPVQQPLQPTPVQQPLQPAPVQQAPEKPAIISLTSTHSGKGPKEFQQITDSSRTKSASHIECPKCGSAVPIPSQKRPLTVQCPNCGAKGRLEADDKVTQADLAQLGYMSVDEVVSLGDEAFKSGAYNKAYVFFTKALEIDPTHRKAMFFKKKAKSILSKRQKQTGPRVKVRQITKVPTGVRRLDDLMSEGLPFKSSILALGPSFIGKEILLNTFACSTLKDDIPVLIVLTGKSPDDIKNSMSFIVPNYVEFERKGLVRYIDAYSASMGIRTRPSPVVSVIANPADIQSLINEIHRIQQELLETFGLQKLVFNSLSNIITNIGIKDSLTMVQAIMARSTQFKVTSLYDMAIGIHNVNDINAMEYLMSGIIEFKSDESRNFLKVRGVSDSIKTREWLEYKFSKKEISIIGSFTMDRIA